MRVRVYHVSRWLENRLSVGSTLHHIEGLPSAGLMLVHRLQRWPNIKPTSHVCQDGFITDNSRHPTPPSLPTKRETLNQSWFNVGPPFATLAQHLTSIGSMSHVCFSDYLAKLPGSSIRHLRHGPNYGTSRKLSISRGIKAWQLLLPQLLIRWQSLFLQICRLTLPAGISYSITALAVCGLADSASEPDLALLIVRLPLRNSHNSCRFPTD